ncbi:MAG: hypothetical protein GTO45_26425 [Candidatus Aminicenantes bacterium]|nr:hypothetical protein [Candidatus Aminicenantes bacterium]NIM82411.1 hypothetical protein [Candidatus Aminicenantes bacterium]NIN21959.1 hypothetical protein [Candidatus Aminicenantes bacterium]NIN45475.1 hypothetical protein [Candidatus Aminicenantes bacterium]NIN88306.1 hypothetical protein [Candidatus Aminicenantes bacterium]
MGFKDLFRPKPKWKHRDWRVRKIAVMGLKDQKLLTDIAKNDENYSVRVAAVENLEDQETLAWVVKNDENPEVCEAAVKALEKIGTPKALRAVLDYKRNISEERKAIIKNMSICLSENICICCEKCGLVYTLGVDAHVVTSFGTMDDFLFSINIGREIDFENDRSHPDIVASLDYITAPPNWVEAWDRKKRIKLQLLKGKLRWWKCNDCEYIQIYKLYKT